ncbi:MAG: aryl-sulfate sulfotransferase [Ignavibacteriae bacterium]|nr:aryl-sulfate sulfotransferase [Ignavibacteriota bacterium]
MYHSRNQRSLVKIKLTIVVFLFFIFLINSQAQPGNPLVMTALDNPAPGYILLDSYQSGYLSIIDNSGLTAYKKRLEGLVTARTLSHQPNGLFSYFANQKFYLIDNKLNLVDSFSCKNGLETDFHDFKLLNNGHALLLGIEYDTVDMSAVSPGGKQSATLMSYALQEQDADKNVVWEWHTSEHFNVTDATDEIDLTQQLISWVHTNFIDIDTDGNLIISNRNMDEITKINKQTGEIIWRLGGKKCRNNQFTFLNDTVNGFWGFSHQHSVHKLQNGNLLMFDNGNLKPQKYSRAVEYELDEINKTIRKVWEYRYFPEVFSMSQGSVQRLPNGNTIIGWGTNNQQMTLIEARPDGTRAMEVRNFESYQTLRYPINMASKLMLIQNPGIFDFNDSENNTSIIINAQDMRGAGYVSIERHYYAPHNLSYSDVTPLKTYSQRWVINNNGVDDFEGKIIFKLSGIDSLDSPGKYKIFWRQQEGSGNFSELTTIYNQSQGTLEASINSFGEFILAEPQVFQNPILISPADNSKKIPIAGDLVWRAVPDASAYQMQLCGNNNFTVNLIDTLIISDTTFRLSGLNNNTTYYWRLKSVYGINESNWSDPWNFTTRLMTPKLISPINNESGFSKRGIFRWDSIAGATYYRINISKITDFDSSIVDETGITDTIFSSDKLDYDSVYYWRVRALNFDNKSNWSDTNTFIIEDKKELDSPKLLSPVIFSEDVPLNGELIWQPVENALSYNVELSTYPDFLSFIVSANNIDSTKILYKDLNYNTIYYWHVKALNSGDSSNWSETWYFITRKPDDVKESAGDLVKVEYSGNNKIYVSTNKNIMASKFMLFDMNGRKILNKKINFNPSLLDCSKVEPGIYFYFIYINSTCVTGKILIN